MTFRGHRRARRRSQAILFVADQGMKRSSWQEWLVSTGFQHLIFGERSLTKVAGIYSTAQGAENPRARVRRGGAWTDGQVVLLTPADAKMSRRGIMAKKMDPESRGIWRTICEPTCSPPSWGSLLARGHGAG